MAKLTITNLKAFATAYIAAAKQAGTWTASTDNLYGLLDKVGKQVMLDGSFQDKLPEMDGDNLPLGKTIEEYFIDLILPTDFDSTGANTMAPAYPTTEDASYSYTLGRKTIKTTEPYDNVERAAIDSEAAANMLTKITERLTNSESMMKYADKKQILANVIAEAEAATNAATLVQAIAVPANEATSKAFISAVKTDVESASFANEGHNLGNCLIGAAPSLTLYVKKGVLPVVEVEALAAAINPEKLGFGVTVKVIDDFGNNNTGVYAMLVDPRGIKMHNGYRAVRTQENAEGDFVNFNLHTESTAFISKYTFVKVYKTA